MKLLRNEFFIAFLFLLAYLATNPYVYSFDDQHLEIPILKHIIDPSLYKGDYYVESLTKYFTCWLYPLLAKVITVKQIPTAYLLLFLISRYFMFYWVYRLWLWISGDCFMAVCATLSFFLMGRTEEFLYRSFCHEEFSFIFMFGGLYCFYRNWYVLAAMIFGLGVNFHAIYNLFPMLYMVAFLLFCHPQRFKMIFQTGFVFVLSSLPFLLWQIPISISREVAHPVPVQEWGPLYLLSCPQNFLFGDTPLKDVLGNIHIWWLKSSQYLFLLGLYAFQLAFNPLLRRDKKLHAIVGVSYTLLGVVYVFDYVHPSRFVLDLNLVRVEQFVRFFIMGYTVIWACEQLRNSKPWLAFAAAMLALSCGTMDLIGIFFLGIAAMIFILHAMIQPPLKSQKMITGGVFLLAAGFLVYTLFIELRNFPTLILYWHRDMYIVGGMGAVFLALLIRENNLWLRRLLIIIPLAGSFFIFSAQHYHYSHLRKSGLGFWQLWRNWEDMQFYVRDHTPKDAMIMTPYDTDTGGFRTQSERKVLVCYRDCGIIGFDYAAAVEWQKRIKDIETFKVYTQQPVDQAILMGIFKYKVDYIVFMNYYEPSKDNPLLKKIYQNEVFSLFQVLVKAP